MKTNRKTFIKSVTQEKYVRGVFFPKLVDTPEDATNFRWLYGIRIVTMYISKWLYGDTFKLIYWLYMSGSINSLF